MHAWFVILSIYIHWTSILDWWTHSNVWEVNYISEAHRVHIATLSTKHNGISVNALHNINSYVYVVNFQTW